MKTRTFIFFFAGLMLLAACRPTQSDDYLKKVLTNLEQIQSATYHTLAEAWQPGDTVAAYRICNLVKEYDNPADTTIGASFVSLNCEDTNRIEGGYDGTIRLLVYHEHKGIVIDDFTARPLPFRPVDAPFFNYAKNIVDYILHTEDSLTVESTESGSEYHIKVTIHADRQVEFFGKAHYIPKPPFEQDPTSIYEVWIDKSTGLPYKIRREMEHSISAIACTDIIAFNDLPLDGFNLYSYIPHDYEIRKYEVRKNTRSSSGLVGQKAPGWTLDDMHGRAVSLGDFNSKILLLNFTGIGCGPCVAAIPFLKGLKDGYSADDVELVAIESWVRKPHSLQYYANKHELNYNMLSATDTLLNEYQTGRAAPFFFLLDKTRSIRYVFNGYNQQTTGNDITKAINDLLKE